MQLPVTTLDRAEAGEIELKDEIFGLEARSDILQRVVTWQLAKRRAGTHKTKGRSEVRGSTQKQYKQKGTGRARRSTSKVSQFRGGGVAFGPLPRDHAIDLPKKVRRLGLKMALSSKAKDGKLIVLDAAGMDEPRTKVLAGKLREMGLGSVLFIDGAETDTNFRLAARNLVGVDLLPSQGANVYDILRRDTLVLTRAAVAQLEERLS